MPSPLLTDAALHAAHAAQWDALDSDCECLRGAVAALLAAQDRVALRHVVADALEAALPPRAAPNPWAIADVVLEALLKP